MLAEGVLDRTVSCQRRHEVLHTAVGRAVVAREVDRACTSLGYGGRGRDVNTFEERLLLRPQSRPPRDAEARVKLAIWQEASDDLVVSVGPSDQKATPWYRDHRVNQGQGG